jgi:hypothetical protein
MITTQLFNILDYVGYNVTVEIKDNAVLLTLEKANE